MATSSLSEKQWNVTMGLAAALGILPTPSVHGFCLWHLSRNRAKDRDSLLYHLPSHSCFLWILLAETFTGSLVASLHVGHIDWLCLLPRPHTFVSSVHKSTPLCFGGRVLSRYSYGFVLLNASSYYTAHSVRHVFPSRWSFKGGLFGVLLTRQRLSQ